MGNTSFGSQETIDEVKLLWIRLASREYRLLSVNIAREICEYLRSYTSLVAISAGKVVTFQSESMNPRVMFDLPMGVVIGSGASMCLVGTNGLFLCGGGNETSDCED